VARDAWKTLSRKVRREVFRCARRGEHHPNLHVATAAYRWACTVVPPDESVEEVARGYASAAGTGVAIDAIVGSLMGGAPAGNATGAAVGGVAAQRRSARKIIRVGPPPTL
jgi:hypothetical protein